ncbi:hypothetical protein KY290_008117 [Solanum tuberosum]|uniref:Retroviral polymerase SH3-like domain-containing protein n=1 Tax=Solanum tuberosum TaxID=4113 RepID=A0ABQ7W7F9_SOLTU|nr:hypothetical protein KY290_008117 [Solanum tuberosum]
MYTHDKFQPRSVVAIHMGYSLTTKGYLLYNLKDKQFFLSRDVEFRESTFPFDVPSSTAWHLFPSVNISSDPTPSHDVPPSAIVDSVDTPDLPAVLPDSVSKVSEVRRSQRSTKAPL